MTNSGLYIDNWTTEQRAFLAELKADISLAWQSGYRTGVQDGRKQAAAEIMAEIEATKVYAVA